MKDKRGEIIYAGKAANLRARVMSYFRAGRDVKTRHLVGRIYGIDHITAGSEYEAPLLENTLIKKWARVTLSTSRTARAIPSFGLRTRISRASFEPAASCSTARVPTAPIRTPGWSMAI